MQDPSSRRRFTKSVVTAAPTGGPPSEAQQPGTIRGLDHVALPMQNTTAMRSFYGALGLQVTEREAAISVHLGDQMINFHRPARWRDPAFTLRAPAAKPPCGDLCFVWDGTMAALTAALDRAGATRVEGPVPRAGGRRTTGTSLYVRDPDGNLLEFIIYS
jgi:catechol 2,3-dioxygenase-like lactoylglutathione lyase family enzyme